MTKQRGGSSSVQECFEWAKNKGYTIFGIQNTNECWAQGPDDQYDIYGSANNCNDGKGGAYANSVYEIGSQQHFHY